MSTVIRYPKTNESEKIFAERMQTPPEESKEDNVWNIIKELAPPWIERKKAGICMPGFPMVRKEYWGEQAKYCQPNSFAQLDQFIDNTFGPGKTAIDLGCGTGHITKKLLDCGWNVIAVDPCFSALEKLANIDQSYGNLTLICKKATKFTPEFPVDLVVCKEVLPYINPSKFQSVWEKIHHLYLKKGGHLIGTLFSVGPDPTTFATANKLKEIGAWLLPSKQHILPMFEETGYIIEKNPISIHTQLEGKSRLIFQFTAQKH